MPTAQPRGPAIAIALATLLIAACQSASAQTTSIEGRWRTIDDKTRAAKSTVVIRIVNGEAEGVVERVFAPPAPSEHPICDRCPGDLNGKPIVGMRVMWGFRQNGGEWEGGRVFDPEGKKTYRGKIRVVDNGRKLELRGFVGIPLFGRTQTWVRESLRSRRSASPAQRPRQAADARARDREATGPRTSPG